MSTVVLRERSRSARPPRDLAGHHAGAGDRRVGSRLAQRRDPVDRARHPRHPDPAVLDHRRLRPGVRRAAAARAARSATATAAAGRLLAGLVDLRRRFARRHDGQRPRLADRSCAACSASAPRWSCRPPCPRSPAPSRPSSARGRSARGRGSPAPAPSSVCSPSGLLLEAWSWRSVFGLNVVLAAVARSSVHAALRPGVRRPAHRGSTSSGALHHRRGPGSARLLGHRGAHRGLVAAPARWPGSPSGCVLLGFVRRLGASPTRTRCSTLGCSATARSPPATVSITVQFFAFFGFVFLVLQYLQLVRGDTPSGVRH